MHSRRELLGAAAIGAAAVLNPFRSRAALAAVAGLSPQDERYWFEIQQAFTVDRSVVNLNNGGVSPSPAVVQDAMKRHLDLVTPIVHPELEGLRVTPSVYTTLEEIDRFCEVMEEVVERGLPS